MTIGGNILDYGESTKELSVDLIAMKLLLNSTLSTIGEKFMTLDIKNLLEK